LCLCVLVGDSVARTPTETPTLTTYAARAIGAKLSFAFTIVVYARPTV
jgi:hypothetical protein